GGAVRTSTVRARHADEKATPTTRTTRRRFMTRAPGLLVNTKALGALQERLDRRLLAVHYDIWISAAHYRFTGGGAAEPFVECAWLDDQRIAMHLQERP